MAQYDFYHNVLEIVLRYYFTKDQDADRKAACLRLKQHTVPPLSYVVDMLLARLSSN